MREADQICNAALLVIRAAEFLCLPFLVALKIMFEGLLE